MSDEFGLKIDLLRLARRVAPDEQTEATEAEAARWLAENNFRREGDHWVADAHDIGMLEKDEVLSVWPADEPGSATDDEAGRVDPSWPKPQPYVLTAERRELFRSMPDYDQCVIPEFLCGTPASVKCKWRRVALKLYGKAHYTFMSDYKFVHVDDAPGKLITWRKRGLAPSEHNVVLYPILPELSELIFDKETYRHGT